MTTEDELLHACDRYQLIAQEHGADSDHAAQAKERYDSAAGAYLFEHAMSTGYSQEQAAAMVRQLNVMPPAEALQLCRKAWGWGSSLAH